MNDAAGEGTAAEGADQAADVPRWNNRPERTVEEGTRGGGAPQPTPEPRLGPTRNPERDWGVVLVALAVVVIVIAAGIGFAVLVGGILGVLPARGAVTLTLLLVAIGLAGLHQGWRAYHGR